MAPTRTLLALLAAATLALTGCGGDDKGGGGKLSYEDSPLTKYLSALYYDGLSPDASPQERDAYYKEQHRLMEDQVAKCMTEQGFEYIPNVDTGGVSYSDDSEDLWRPDDRDWVEKYGYGSVNDPWREREETAAPVPEATAPVDPNEAYVEGLSEAERNAYYEALHGKGQAVEPGQEDEPQEYDWTTAGCYGAAQHEIMGDQPWEQEENKAILDTLQKFYEGLEKDPAFAKLDSDWAACMTEKNYGGFKKQGDAQESIWELTNKYWESAPQGEGEQDPTFGTMKDPAFAKLAEQEIPLALADLDCREETDYRQQQLRIQFAAEEQFIADNKQELDAFKARIEQGRKK